MNTKLKKSIKVIVAVIAIMPVLCFGQEGHVQQLGSGRTFAGLNVGTSNLSSTHFGENTGENSTGYSNTFMGHNAGRNNGSDGGNTFIGISAGQNNVGADNFFGGRVTGAFNQGSYNAFSGSYAGYFSEGSRNIFSGYKAGYYNKQDGNVYIGHESGYSNDGTYGGGNVLIGRASGRNASIISSTFIGSYAGFNSSGYYSVYLGASAGYNAGGSYNVFLGAFAGYSETGSNKLYIDNSSTTTPLIYGKFDTDQVGINTNDIPIGYAFAVKGKIIAEEVKVKLYANGWPDYVFYDDYNLPTLKEVEKHIKEKRHLPNIPSAEEVAENGVLIGDMNAKLLKKIEELTLYTIAQEKQLEAQNKKNKSLENRLQNIETLITTLSE